MKRTHAARRSFAVLAVLIAIAFGVLYNPDSYQTEVTQPESVAEQAAPSEALDVLHELEVKGRAPKTGYTRAQFGNGWSSSAGCDTRNRVLARDLENTVVNERCQVVTGILHDPYTSRTIEFQRGASSSQAVQIDHVVALSDAWQKGAQQLMPAERAALANDPLELLAVDGPANQQKGDGDAATWLPPNRTFRCQYVARQIAVKKKYRLWVTQAEKDAMVRVLSSCPGQRLPVGAVIDEQVLNSLP